MLPDDTARRMAPDLRGCELHGQAEWSVYKDGSGRCAICTRAQYHSVPRPNARGRYNGPRCIRGHLKTRFTWVKRPNASYFYCVTCNRANARRGHERRRAQQGKDQAA